MPFGLEKDNIIDAEFREVNKKKEIPAKTSKKQGFFSKATYALDRAGRKTGKKIGKGIVNQGKKLPGRVLAAAEYENKFKTAIYNKRKIALERKENITKHKANISGLRSQRAQSKADLLEARHKQYQVRQEARKERQLNRSTGSLSSAKKYNIYGKSGGGFFSKGGPQYQVRQEARKERQLNRSTGSLSSAKKYNIYGKSGGGFFSKGGPPKGV